MRDEQDQSMMERLRASLVMLCFGMATLAVLIAIDRQQWFHLKPVTGTAAAISHASSKVGDDRSAQARAQQRHERRLTGQL